MSALRVLPNDMVDDVAGRGHRRPSSPLETIVAVDSKDVDFGQSPGRLSRSDASFRRRSGVFSAISANILADGATPRSARQRGQVEAAGPDPLSPSGASGSSQPVSVDPRAENAAFSAFAVQQIGFLPALRDRSGTEGLPSSARFIR